MEDKAFQKLLNDCAKAAGKHNDLCVKVNDECKRRYGVEYGEVDADGIIDVLNYYGADSFSLKEFEEAMELADQQRIDI